MQQHYVIIVAGGSGKRFGGDIPKQFIEINQKPVIFHTIEKFLAFDAFCHFIIAIQKEYHEYWKTLVNKHDFKVKHQLSTAGEERFHTVKNALELVHNNCIVGIHDAVRPLVAKQTIENCFFEIKNNKAVIPVVPVINSLRKLEGDENIAIDRSLYREVQTPQYFYSIDIKEAYNQSFSSKFTDDASVFESVGGKIKLVDGNPENIKITELKDLDLAQILLKEV